MTGQVDMEVTGRHAAPTRSAPLPAASSAAISGLEQQVWRFFQKGNLEMAAKLAERVVHHAPRRPWAHYLLGEIEVKRQAWSLASAHFQRAIELGREDAETLIRAGEASMKAGENATAIRFIERALEQPDDAITRPRRRALQRALEQLAARR